MRKKRLCTLMILTLLVLSMAVSVFVACEKTDKCNVSFVSEESVIKDAMSVDEAKVYLESLPTRDGYVFAGWYLDKDVWEQEVKSIEDLDSLISNGRVNVYAKWIEIIDAITILFLDYNNASLLEYKCDRSSVDLSFLKPSAKPDDNKYSYTFDHWDCDMSDLTKVYYTATPVYKAELRSFDVRYYVDGELVHTEKVRYGENSSASRITPDSKPSTAQYDYTFAGWDGTTSNITSDVNLYARYEETLRKYKVEFNYGDSLKSTVYVNYGEAAVAPQSTAKSPTTQYKYDFVGWDNVFDCVTADIVVNARYVEQTRLYNVSFYVDDTCIQSSSELYGANVTAPTGVVKNLNDGYIYVFTGWDKNFSRITGDTVVNAQFDKQSQTFEIEYLNWNGEVLFTDSVQTGESSQYKDEVATRDSDSQYEYEFIGWTSADKLGDVRASLTVYAQFEQKVRSYTVTFYYGDGEEYACEVEYGKAAIAPQDVNKTDTSEYKYEFLGWDNVFDFIVVDTVVNAQYSEQTQVYQVSFYVDDECVKSTYEQYGASVSAPTNVVKVKDDGLIYTFTGWDNDFDFISADTVVNAIFEIHTQTFKVTYVNWDGTILFVDEVESQEVSSYPYDDPTREPNAKFEYDFSEWLDEDDQDCEAKLGFVTQSFAVYAQFTAQIRKYTVTFVFGDDESFTFEGVEYGSNLTGQEPKNTDKTSTAEFEFTFIGWYGYYGYVESDLTIEATYTSTTRKYEIKFVNDGEVIKAQEVAYGNYPTAPSTVSISPTEEFNYTFLGWSVIGDGEEWYVLTTDGYSGIDVGAVEVKGEITYTAIYLRKIQQYVVTFYNEQVLGVRVQVGQITVDYGTNAKELAPTVTRDKTQVYVYTFSNWSKDISFVKTDMEVDAIYEQELRTYVVNYYNDDVLYCTREVQYGKGVADKPENPTKPSTAEFDFEFVEWRGGDENNIIDDTDLYAYYNENRRQYRVTFFDLSVYEFISTTTLYYGDKIEKIIERDGYYFDAWYRDPDCTTMFNMDVDFVDGIMMLFGNTVMRGIEHRVDTSGLINKTTYGTITGYTGTLSNVILPRVIGGLKMTAIDKEAFANNTVMESIYIPNCYSSVGASIFKNIEELDIYTEAVNGWMLDYPYGWNSCWNSNSNTVVGQGNSKRLVTNNVENIVTSGDYRYILVNGNAIIDKFVNNNTTRAYIEEKLEYKKPSFIYEDYTDEKTGDVRKIYGITYEIKEYNITTISPSAFSGCKNLASVFIPKTITSVKKYAFSGISVNIYIQREAPALGEVPSGWSLSWNSNRSGDEGERTLCWGVIGMDEVGDFTYIFKGDGTAIVAEYNGTALALSTVTIPDTVTYRSPSDSNAMIEYTVTELGDELFSSGMSSLLSFSSIILPSNLKRIGSKVFYLNTSLSSITLPDTLEEIGAYAFVGTMSLKEIFLPASIKKIGTFCFAGSSATIYIGRKKALVETGFGLYWNIKLELGDIQKLTSLSGFAGLVFSPTYLPTYYNVASKYTDTYDNTNSLGTTVAKTDFEYVLYNDGTAMLVGYSKNGIYNHVSEYSIPETIEYNGVTYTVTAIGDKAFADNSSLKTLNIPASVKDISSTAFSGCREDLEVNNYSTVDLSEIFAEAEQA